MLWWQCKQHSTVARSNTEAKYKALANASTELLWLQSLTIELGISITNPPILWCDNIDATYLTANPTFHARTKHIEMDVHFIREKVETKQLEVRYCPTDEQVADVLTKALSPPKFKYLCSKLHLSCT